MANFNTFKSINDLLKAFPTEKSSIRYLERKLWPNGEIVSPYDPTSKVYRRVMVCTAVRIQARTSTLE